MEIRQVIYPTRDEQIDQDLARYLYEHHCSILIVEHLPVGSAFGIDLSLFEIGDKFKGVKLIPPGVHFVYASSIDKSGRHHGPRCGFYHNFSKKEILIKRWSVLDEDFDDKFEASEEEKHRYANNLRDLDTFLGAYRFSTYESFLKLTDRLTPDVLSSLLPKCKRIRSIPYLTEEGGKADSSGNRIQRKPRRTLNEDHKNKPSCDKELLPDFMPESDTQIKFTFIPDDHASFSLSSQSEITEFNLDSSMKLESSFGANEEEELYSFLGEFQFAFVTLILGHVYSCFEQWRKLLSLACLADSALSKHKDFFVKFMKTLYTQLEHIPEDIFEDVLDEENLIRRNLDVLFQNIDELSSNPLHGYIALKEQASGLRAKLEKKFGWQFNLELDDEQPVLVDL